VQDPEVHRDRVERRVGERQPQRIAHHEREVGTAHASPFDHRGRDVPRLPAALAGPRPPRRRSLVGSKGLSASYVFIVGFNNGSFPRESGAITDDEVCKLLVALSRTRIECHVVSVGHFGAGWLEESTFADWIRAHLDPITINKEHFASR
jgi:hypothetical protein